MLKRKAHIVFFSQKDPNIASAAVQILTELHSPDCEARSCQSQQSLDGLAQWVDTVIFINDTAIATQATSKNWSVANQSELRARILGLLGGLKLLQRTADDD